MSRGSPPSSAGIPESRFPHTRNCPPAQPQPTMRETGCRPHWGLDKCCMRGIQARNRLYPRGEQRKGVFIYGNEPIVKTAKTTGRTIKKPLVSNWCKLRKLIDSRNESLSARPRTRNGIIKCQVKNIASTAEPCSIESDKPVILSAAL